MFGFQRRLFVSLLLASATCASVAVAQGDSVYGDSAYDDYGRVPETATSELFLYDPELDSAWPLPEPGAFDGAIPIDDLDVFDDEMDAEAPVAVAPLPSYLEPGFVHSGDGRAGSVLPPKAAAVPTNGSALSRQSAIKQAMEAARRVAPERSAFPRLASPPTPEEAAAGNIPVDDIPSPLDENSVLEPFDTGLDGW
ncbi:MAG: hypothetical protein ACI8TX_001430 [Hyphomicrobiaceae bacterium]